MCVLRLPPNISHTETVKDDAWDAIPPVERPALPFAVPRGTPGVDVEARKGFPTIVTAEDVLGWKFRTLSETLKDTITSFAQHGLL